YAEVRTTHLTSYVKRVVLVKGQEAYGGFSYPNV
ncbi:unnamed protein product, partial [marine sediment metagenome]